MQREAIPYISFVGLMYGSTLIVSRFSTGQFATPTYIAARMVLASLFFVTIYIVSAKRHWPTDKALWIHGTLLGVIATAISMNLVVGALNFLSSGLTSLLLTLYPPCVVIAAQVFLPEERLNQRQVLGVVAAMCGALFMAWRGETGLTSSSDLALLGYGMIALSLVIGAWQNIHIRKYVRTFDSFQVASIRIWTAAVTSILISWLFVGFDFSRVELSGYAALLYASVAGTFLGIMVSLYNTQRFGATTSAMTSYIMPIITTVGGIIFLDETFTVVMGIGMLLIFTGLVLVQAKPQPKLVTQ